MRNLAGNVTKKMFRNILGLIEDRKLTLIKRKPGMPNTMMYFPETCLTDKKRNFLSKEFQRDRGRRQMQGQNETGKNWQSNAIIQTFDKFFMEGKAP